ncbi:MAG TPA: hypothetical protein VGK49_00555, partial [Ilumatobacteraceae bacterium]
MKGARSARRAGGRRIPAAALVALAILAALTVRVPTAHAHSPHDVVVDVELSPEFEQDGTAYAIVRDYLLRSDDGGDTWTRVV